MSVSSENTAYWEEQRKEDEQLKKKIQERDMERKALEPQIKKTKEQEAKKARLAQELLDAEQAEEDEQRKLEVSASFCSLGGISEDKKEELREQLKAMGAIDMCMEKWVQRQKEIVASAGRF